MRDVQFEYNSQNGNGGIVILVVYKLGSFFETNTYFDQSTYCSEGRGAFIIGKQISNDRHILERGPCTNYQKMWTFHQ